MASNSVGSVSIDLIAKYATLQSDMGKAVSIVESSFKKMIDLATTAGAAIGVAFSAGAVISWGTKLIDAADQMGKLSQKTGVGVETLSAYAQAADKAGVDTDTFASSLTKLNKNADEAEAGNKGAAAAFQRIGISVDQLRKLSPDQLLVQIADKMSQYADGAAKTAEAQALFGKAGAAMIPLLNQGGEALQEAQKNAADLGATMSGDLVKQASDFNDHLANMKLAAEGVGNSILSSLLPALNDMGRSVETALKSDDFKQWKDDVTAYIDEWVYNTEHDIRNLSAAWSEFMTFLDKIGEDIVYTWQEDVDKFMHMWDVGVNYVKGLWQSMVEGLAKQAGALPWGTGDALQQGLTDYAGSIKVATNLSDAYNAQREKAAADHQKKLDQIAKDGAAAREAILYPPAPPMDDLARPGKKQLPPPVDQGAIDKAQAALDALQKSLDGFYAKNLESGDAIQDQQAASIRQLDALGAAAITAGVSVDKVQTMMKSGLEQIALTAQKATDAQNRQFDDYVKQQQDKLDNDKAALDLQVQAVGMSDKEIKQAQDMLQITKDTTAAIDAQQKLRDKGTISEDEYQRRIDALRKLETERVQATTDANDKITAAQTDWLNGASRAYKNFMDQAKDVASQTATVMQDAFSSFTDAFANMLTTGTGHFKDFATSVLTDLAKMETRIAMSKILSAFFGGGSTTGDASGSGMGGMLSSLFQGWGGVADGGVFPSRGGISSLSGGVYNSPQFFKFASGGAVLGEAGYEGVMPLTRNSQGKLGVMASGSGSNTNNVNVSVNVDNSGNSSTSAAGSDDQMRTLGNMIATKTREVITSEQRPGGILWRQSHA
jgi:lambda family phage tail tape measure protein